MILNFPRGPTNLNVSGNALYPRTPNPLRPERDSDQLACAPACTNMASVCEVFDSQMGSIVRVWPFSEISAAPRLSYERKYVSTNDGWRPKVRLKEIVAPTRLPIQPGLPLRTAV